eukprot:TRINITY_DN15615_c1_g1_i3.p1 TRINITY_DN15615_c1_g1~~TRINITY_DN15615_c1_g1_i3.p1  ORF type:complete len:570 (+),score=130.52 TRINITY_DN15615_c1_g1_i3:223-1932(+)
MAEALSAAQRVKILLARCQKLKEAAGDKVSLGLDRTLQSLSAKAEQLRKAVPATQEAQDDWVEEGEEEEEKEVDVEVESDARIDCTQGAEETPDCQLGHESGMIYASMLDDYETDEEQEIPQAEEAVCNTSRGSRSRSRSRQGRRCAAASSIWEDLPAGTLILERYSCIVERKLGQSGSKALYAVRDQQGSALVAQVTPEESPGSTLGQVQTPFGQSCEVFIHIFMASEFVQTLSTVMTELTPRDAENNAANAFSLNHASEPILGKPPAELLQRPNGVPLRAESTLGELPAKLQEQPNQVLFRAEPTLGELPAKLLEQPDQAPLKTAAAVALEVAASTSSINTASPLAEPEVQTHGPCRSTGRGLPGLEAANILSRPLQELPEDLSAGASVDKYPVDQASVFTLSSAASKVSDRIKHVCGEHASGTDREVPTRVWDPATGQLVEEDVPDDIKELFQKKEEKLNLEDYQQRGLLFQLAEKRRMLQKKQEEQSEQQRRNIQHEQDAWLQQQRQQSQVSTEVESARQQLELLQEKEILMCFHKQEEQDRQHRQLENERQQKEPPKKKPRMVS